ncbi:MAG: DNA-binding protein HU-beta [Patescibacteria group bacterium]|jgi:DNA-binding protein HU-beta|nr:DNA-binding protein HU-beta [Patescibacteria group bacterium]
MKGGDNMTKKDLIEVVAKKANLTNKASRDAVQTTLNTIRDSLKRGEKVVLTGFGTFSVRSRQQRIGRNPKTGERITLAARKAPGFTPGKTFKKAIR